MHPLYLLTVYSVYVVQRTNAADSSILDRIAKLEEGQARCMKQNGDLQNTVKALEEKNRILEYKLNAYEMKDRRMKSRINTIFMQQNSVIKQALDKLHSSYNLQSSIHRRQLGSSTGIAFSSFLDHDVDNLGPEQGIVFNQVQLNDGGGYNEYTGVFTVPVSGVYVFTFFIGERDTNQLYVKLVVNGVTKSDAVAETVSSSHDSQGGNVVVLNVKKGDAVMVQHNTWGSHIEGYPDIRLSTFSGFLLYTTDNIEVIGK